jgi:tRNA threonylcarbamoyladenosine biosynthesis protein TsaE
MEWTFTLDQISPVAEAFRAATAGSRVIAFHGPMGSGKTTFIHAWCEVMGVKDMVGSPTFSIINEYRYETDGIKKRIFHIDLFRLADEEEALKAGVEDCLNSGSCCLVEWPEKAPGLFPADTRHVYLEIIDDKTRRLKITDI